MDFVRLAKLTSLLFHHSQWKGGLLEAQDLALKIMREFNL